MSSPGSPEQAFVESYAAQINQPFAIKSPRGVQVLQPEPEAIRTQTEALSLYLRNQPGNSSYSRGSKIVLEIFMRDCLNQFQSLKRPPGSLVVLLSPTQLRGTRIANPVGSLVRNRGGGLVVGRRTDDGVLDPVALFDVSTQRNSDIGNKIDPPGMNTQFEIPSLVFTLGNTNVRFAGRSIHLRHYLPDVIRNSILAGDFSALDGMSRLEKNQFLGEMAAKVTDRAADLKWIVQSDKINPSLKSRLLQNLTTLEDSFQK